MSQSVNQELIEFLDNSPTCFQAVENLKNMLKKEGFGELLECEKWEIVPGGKYFVTRNDSSIIAFSVPKKEFNGFQLICSHTDSPSFKLKENAEMDADGKYTKLNVEGYAACFVLPGLTVRFLLQEGSLSAQKKASKPVWSTWIRILP